MQKQEFTIGQVARIVQVNPPTVRKWFDAGRLKGHRRDGGVRIVPREDLICFLKEHGMPLRNLETEDEVDERMAARADPIVPVPLREGSAQVPAATASVPDYEARWFLREDDALGLTDSIRVLAKRLGRHDDQVVMTALCYLGQFADAIERDILGAWPQQP